MLNAILFIILIRWYYAWTSVKWKKYDVKLYSSISIVQKVYA